MDGTDKARRERWMKQAEAAYQKMFESESEEELVTLSQQENLAVLIGKELTTFLLEERVNMEPVAKSREQEAAVECCPKCGQPGVRASTSKAGKKPEERFVTTRAGRICIRRQRWRCPKCRIDFFPGGRSIGLGDGGL